METAMRLVFCALCDHSKSILMENVKLKYFLRLTYLLEKWRSHEPPDLIGLTTDFNCKGLHYLL